MEFDKEKFKTVLSYIINRCENKKNVGKTVICKLLYFSDFNYYEKYETSITNETYIKSKRGIRPLHFRQVSQYLIDNNKLFFRKEPYYNRTIHKYYPLIIPNVKFSEKELEIIDYWIDKLGGNNASSITRYAIRDPPIIIADFGEEIDFRHVFSRNYENPVINSFI